MMLRRCLSVLVLLVGLNGVAMAQEGLRDPRDPWEKFNRGVYAFNDAADTYVLKPVAETYVAVTPLPARTWVANFLGNFGDTWIAFNNLLQGKFGDAASDVGRILVNSTVGILGTFDVATEMGLEKHDEDFGQTLAVWGVGGGPFVEVPLFGPRTLRDGAALFVDKYVDPFRIIDRVAVRNTMAGMQIVSDRSFLLGAETVLDNAALDKYAYRRDFYLKRRTYLIYDGNPPRDDEEE